jgi:hypothetical protein
MKHLIDEPSPFAGLAEWEAFLSDVRKIKPRTDDVREAIATAEKRISELKGGG